METRFNPIQLNSILAFVNIHSRSTALQRQVYFVRADGTSPALPDEIAAADKAMRSAPKTAYSRLNRLASLTDPAEIQSYVQQYAAFKEGKDALLPRLPGLSAEFAEALREVLFRLRAARPDLSETAERNYAVQLLHRTDVHLTELLAKRDSAFCKLIYAGCTGTSEYLFGCLAAQMGIDTLILMPEGTGKIPEKLLGNCAVISYGSHAPVTFPEYQSVQPVPVPQAPPREIKRTPPPPRPSAPAVQPRMTRHNVQPSAPVHEAPRERSYEELAELAQSVVMIVVHDRTGKPVASGSGIMIHRDGYILTNCHVVREGCAFSVRIENDDQVYKTQEVIKYHPVFDLALIRIRRTLLPLPVYDGRRALHRGEKVFAIGSPLGLFNSVSDGIISGFRSIDDCEMIQFTAPISHGSSGGALLNTCGELIGICTGGIDEGQNLNLAVDYQQIRYFAGNFLK